MVLLLEDELAAAFGMRKSAIDVGASMDKAVVQLDVAGERRLVVNVDGL